MKELDRIEAMILMGGLGIRLRTSVPDRPKSMASVSGRPFVEYLFTQLMTAGISRVILLTGYMGDYVKQYYGNSFEKLEILYSREPFPLGTGGAIRYAKDMISTDNTLIMNGDSYCNVNLKTFIRTHVLAKAETSMVISFTTDASAYGSVRIKDKMISIFKEKTGIKKPGWINSGIYLISRNQIDRITDGKVSLEKDLFPQWIHTGIHAFPSENPMIDIGTPASYANAQLFFSQPENSS